MRLLKSVYPSIYNFMCSGWSTLMYFCVYINYKTYVVSTYFIGMEEILAAGDHHETGKLVVRRRITLNLNRKVVFIYC